MRLRVHQDALLAVQLADHKKLVPMISKPESIVPEVIRAPIVL